MLKITPTTVNNFTGLFGFIYDTENYSSKNMTEAYIVIGRGAYAESFRRNYKSYYTFFFFFSNMYIFSWGTKRASKRENSSNIKY